MRRDRLDLNFLLGLTRPTNVSHRLMRDSFARIASGLSGCIMV